MLQVLCSRLDSPINIRCVRSIGVNVEKCFICVWIDSDLRVNLAILFKRHDVNRLDRFFFKILSKGVPMFADMMSDLHNPCQDEKKRMKPYSMVSSVFCAVL
jgi:hypothetical protein